MYRQSTNSKKIPQELKDVCANSLKDDNKKIYLEKIYIHLEKDNKLAHYVWDYNGIPVLLLQEITNTYFILGTKDFTREEGSKIIIILKILRILVKEREIKRVFVESMFLYYIYVFLTMYTNEEMYEKISLATIDVTVALLVDSNQYVQNHVKSTEIVPLILKNIDLGSENTKIRSIEVFLLIINSNEGLGYACQTFDRFSVINQVFNSVGFNAMKNPSIPVFRGIFKVYIRMCDKPQIKNILKGKRPEYIFNDKVVELCSGDEEAMKLYNHLIRLLN